MMATAQQFIETALSQLGEGEKPAGSNKTKYGKWFGSNGVAWCAIFQSWCFDQVGMSKIRSAWCDDFVSHAKNHTWGTLIDARAAISPGDLAIFDWNGGTSDHIAAVAEVLPGGQWRSIEGNWSDKVTQVVRGRENIRCFIRPKFDHAAKPSPLPVHDDPHPAEPIRVAMIQQDLNYFLIHQHFPQLGVDGSYGPQTTAATRMFQEFANAMYKLAGKKTRLNVDGIVGTKTLPVLTWWAHQFRYGSSTVPVPDGIPALKVGCPDGDEVRRLQAALNVVTGSNLVVDGVFGPATKKAVIAYQEHCGLAEDGIYGPQTAAALTRASRK